MQLKSFFSYSQFKKKYLTQDRKPFFQIAANYINGNEKTILDIGSGEAEFYSFLKDKGYNINNLYLLDGNETTVEKNKQLTANSLFYLVPDKLPFADNSVEMIHMSHLTDCLEPNDLYSFLVEISRIIKTDGHIVISTPMLWSTFYNDLSHTRPYNPFVFYKYFVKQDKSTRYGKVPGDFEMVELVYRYTELPLDEGWSSNVPVIDYLFITFRRVLGRIGIKRLEKNGYTLVLKKINE